MTDSLAIRVRKILHDHGLEYEVLGSLATLEGIVAIVEKLETMLLLATHAEEIWKRRYERNINTHAILMAAYDLLKDELEEAREQ